MITLITVYQPLVSQLIDMFCYLDFYQDWEDVMVIGCNNTEFYFSV